MSEWLITMGDFESSHGYVAVIRAERDSLSVVDHSSFRLPDSRVVPSKGFTGAAYLPDRRLLVCGFNALYAVDLENRICEPWLVRDDFNDLHDVTITRVGGETRVVVANTGHDRVDFFDEDGRLVKALALTPMADALGHAEDDPYFMEVEQLPVFRRKLRDKVHPNTVTRFGNSYWIARFSDRSIHRLDDPAPRIELDACPHDLVPDGNSIWFTTTDGRVWSFDSERSEGVALEFDTFELSGRSGWVRGLWIDDSRLLLGFTRISRMPRERWADRPFSETESGILLIDRRSGRELDWLSLDSLSAHPKVYSILPRFV